MSFDHDEWRRDSAKAYEDRMRAKHRYPVRRIGRSKSKAERREKFRREHGSEERVRWVQGLPCVFCGRRPCDNAHVTNEGTGRKAHHTMVVPACKDRTEDGTVVRGCHWQMDHGIGKRAMEREHGIDLYAEAERVAKEWRQR